MDLNSYLTPHFRLWELIVPEKTILPEIDDIIISNLTIVCEKLEDIRSHFNKPITVNSGYRTFEHNKQVGGELHSYHRLGKAADIVVLGIPAKDVQEYLKNWKGGLGLYKGFTHIDIRPYKARWRG